VFTSFADDAYAGDTNKDGPSVGSPGDWGALLYQDTSDSSSASHLVVRHGGSSNYPGISLGSADITLEDSTVELCSGDGIALNGSTKGATIARCTVQNCSGIAIAEIPIDAVAGMSGNTASGNGGNYVQMSTGALGTDLTLTRDALIGDVLVLGTSINVPAGRNMAIAPGVILKSTWNYCQVWVQGSLDVRGTAFEPVVMTSFADDRYGGDTNNDGPSTGSPADWTTMRYLASATASSVENLIVAYAGAQGFSAFSSASPYVTARAVRVEHAQGKGIRATALAGHALNWVAFACGDVGIDLADGSYLVAHATSAHNSGTGILRGVNWSGTVYNSISWGNAPNYSGFAAGELQWCDGSASFAGTQGNIDADPLFVDPSPGVGDLLLQAASPCFDAANDAIAYGTEKDWLENPRLLDPTLSGVLLPDMGAYERALWDLVLVGSPILDTSFSLTTTGPPGDTIYAIGILDGSAPFPPFGMILAGQPQTLLILPFAIPVGTPLQFQLPDAPSLLGYTLGIQGLVLPPPGPLLVGNMSRLFRGTIRL
jgi:parallel beta-helix repeat protein